MFVIKYHAKGRKSVYFGIEKRVRNKQCALAFGEDLRSKFKYLENEHCTLETIKVSKIAEMMYSDKWIKVSRINW